VAAAALTDDRHARKTYVLTGPRSLTNAEQIELIGRGLGRTLRYEELSPEEAREVMGPHAPADLLMETWEKHRATPAPVTDTVERITGRPARSVEQWAADYPAG
jgi:hypothetical protein